MKWINVKDRLPFVPSAIREHDLFYSHPVLAIDTAGNQWVVKYAHASKSWANQEWWELVLGEEDYCTTRGLPDFYETPLTHWMPLPQPPKNY